MQRNAKCVRCEEAHYTVSCEKPGDAADCCTNCDGAHTANYRDSQHSPTASVARPFFDNASVVRPSVSYTSVVKPAVVVPQTASASSSENKPAGCDILLQFLRRLDLSRLAAVLQKVQAALTAESQDKLLPELFVCLPVVLSLFKPQAIMVVQKRKPISLQMAFWNANALFNRKLELGFFVTRYDLDVVLVNETHLREGDIARMANYNVLGTIEGAVGVAAQQSF